jgi:hypothetical protein
MVSVTRRYRRWVRRIRRPASSARCELYWVHDRAVSPQVSEITEPQIDLAFAVPLAQLVQWRSRQSAFELDEIVLRQKRGSPWLQVQITPFLQPPEDYAIWNATGLVYRVIGGAAEDDPIEFE